jgi:predicted restriction endonuclease
MLDMKVNKGKRHRIMRSGISSGSLWVTPGTEYYYIAPTGEVGALMYDFLHSHFGDGTDEKPKGRWKYWKIRGIEEVSKIIRHFGEYLAPLRDEEGDRDNTNHEAGYSPQAGGRRQVVERQIRERRGQQQFRDALCKRCGNRCLVTGSEVLAVLEAAHIKPYRGEDDNHPENGLLLRADIHTLFDLDKLGIEPEELCVKLQPDLAKDKEYGSLAGETLCCTHDQRPSKAALQLRYAQFQQQVDRPA